MKIPALMIFTAIVLQVSFGKKLRLLTGMVPGVLNPGYMAGGAQPPLINMGGGYLQPQYPQMLPGVPLPPMIPSQPYGIPYAPNGLPQQQMPYMVPFSPNPSLQQPLPGQMVSPANGRSPNYPSAPQPIEANPAQQHATGGPGWDGVWMGHQAMTPAPRTQMYKGGPGWDGVQMGHQAMTPAPRTQMYKGGPGWDGVQMGHQAMTPAPRTRIYKRFAPRMTYGASLSTSNEVPTQIMPTPTEDEALLSNA